MRISTITGTALLALGVTAFSAGTVQAQPAPTYSRPAPGTYAEAPLDLRGTFREIAYEVAATEDRHNTVTTVQSGRFELINDNTIVTLTDDAGAVVAALPMAIRLNDQQRISLNPAIDESGKILTLAPAGMSDIPLRDVSAQERFFAEAERHMPSVLTGAAIGAAIGFVLGFPLGLFVFDVVTVPITTAAGAAIGALAGLAHAGGQPAIDAASAYFTGAS